MKKYLMYCFMTGLVSAAISACEKSVVLDPYISDETDAQHISHEMIVLGEKLEDPYSVTNMTKALQSLYPTKATRIEVKPTDIYARFQPMTTK